MEQGTNTSEMKLLTGAIILTTLAVGAFLYVGASHTSADEYVAQAKEHVFGENYDLQAAKQAYEHAVAQNPAHQEALFNLARVYYILGEYEESFATIQTYKDLYPEEKRIHYIAGLANGLSGNLFQAEMEFKEFLASDIDEWQGYLDLAWVYFQQGEFDRAKSTLEMGIERHGHNAWLNTSLGAALVALGEYEEAEKTLRVASVQMNHMTVTDWQHNFSYNGPETREEQQESMRAAIEANMQLAQSAGTARDVAAVTRALNSNFVAASPRGMNAGLAVSACGSSDHCQNISCTSSPNACGQVSAGSYSVCTHSGTSACNATPPSLPNGFGDTCQVTNSCGNTSTGTIGCDGLCDATPPGSCDPFGPSISSGACVVDELYTVNVTGTDPEGDNVRYGIDWNNDDVIDQYVPGSGYVSSGTTQAAGNIFTTEGVKTIQVLTEDDGGEQSVFVSHSFVCNESSGGGLLGGDGDGDGDGDGGQLTAQPLLVQSGNTTNLIWDTEGVSNCTVTGTNGDEFTGTSGSQISGAITEATFFELICDNGAITDSVTVNVVPLTDEF